VSETHDEVSAQDSPDQDPAGPDAAVEPSEDALEDAVEEDLALAALAKERDEYLDALKRLQADFENYKKRIIRQQTEHLERAAEALVEKLLPVLDTFDLALVHDEGFDQVLASLMGVLEKEGLERIQPDGAAFDPNEHDAVAHEPRDNDAHGAEVIEVMRPGYRWKGRVVRPAMVKVKG
jgi:molecular chaperone GrpE